MKKVLSLIAFLVVGLITLVGCSENKSPENSKEEGNDLTIWATNINVPVLEKAAEYFQKENPDFNLIVEEMGNNDIRSKITTGLQAGGQGLPDAALLVDDGITGYTERYPDAFVNLSKMGFDEHATDFPKYKIDSVSMNGDTYAVPFDAGPVGVFYRKDLFEKAGVNPEEINNWNDYIEAGLKVKEATGANMLSYDSNESTVYTILMSQQGVGYFSEDGESNIDTNESLQTASLLSDFAKNDILLGTPGWDAWVTSLSTSQTATAITGAWLIGTLGQQVPDQKGDWGVMPLPAFEEGGSRSANQGGSSFAIFEGSKNQDLAYDFLQFFATNYETQELAMEGGLFPSYLPVYESDLFSEPVEYFGGEPVWSVFAEEMNKIPSVRYSKDDGVARDEAVKIQAEVVEGSEPGKSIKDARGRVENMTK